MKPKKISFSKQQQIVVQHLLTGKGSNEIAKIMNVSQSNIATVKERIFVKLGVSNVLQLYRKMKKITRCPNQVDGKTTWIATVVFKDGTELHTNPFFNNAIYEWSNQFLLAYGDIVEDIYYEQLIKH